MSEELLHSGVWAVVTFMDTHLDCAIAQIRLQLIKFHKGSYFYNLIYLISADFGLVSLVGIYIVQEVTQNY